MMTNASYKSLLQNEYDNTSSTAGAVIEQAIKDTYQETLRFVGRYLIPFEFDDIAVTIDNAEYTPTAFLEVLSAHWKKTGSDRFVELREITQDSFVHSSFIDAPSGEPFRYLLNSSIKVRTVPAPNVDGTLRIVYIPVQEELSGSVVSVIPDRFTRVILLGSLARLKAYDGLPDATEYRRLFIGPNGDQGIIGGAVAEMIRELSTVGQALRPSLGGR